MQPESEKTGTEGIIERLSDQEKLRFRSIQDITDAVALQAAATLGEVPIGEKELASLIEDLSLTPSNIVTMNRLMGRVIDTYRYSHEFNVPGGTDPIEFLGEETPHGIDPAQRDPLT